MAMSVSVGGAQVPPDVPVRFFKPHEVFGWLARIVRQIGEVGAGHRLRRTTTAGARYAGKRGYCQQDDGKFSQHVALSVRVMAPRASILARRRPWSQWRYPIWVAAAALLWCGFLPASAIATPQIGEAAPPLVVTALDGTIFDLAKLRGKVVLVNYWATWCAPCRKEMPKLDALYRHYHGRGLEIISISIDFPRDYEKMRKAARSVTYPTAATKDISNDGFGKPGGVPITWIIDADGKVRDRMIDVRDELLNGIVVPLLPH